MWLGWRTLHIADDGLPTEEATPWVASCFILLTHVVYIGKVRSVEEI